MRRSRYILLVVAALGALWAGAPAASAKASASAVVNDCNAHGRLTAHYTLVQLRDALASLPPSVAEYTNCSDVIHQQLVAQLSGKGGASGDGGGGGFLPTWLVVVLIVLILGGAGATVAARRRRSDGAP